MRNIAKINTVQGKTLDLISSPFKISLIVLVLAVLINFVVMERALGQCDWESFNGCNSHASSCACDYSDLGDSSESTECTAACDSSEPPTSCGSSSCDCTDSFKIDEVEDIIDPKDTSYIGSDPDGSLVVTIDNFEWKDDDPAELVGFNWSSNTNVCAVVVKGGNGVNIYQYDSVSGSISDTCLTSPDPHAISHITFCYPSTADNSITVIKETITKPSRDTDFEFTTTNLPEDEFTLTVLKDQFIDLKTFSDLGEGTYTITETVPDLWYLNNISISGDDNSNSDINGNSVDVELDDGEDITVTFKNEKLEIDIIGDPPGLEITQKESSDGKFSLRYDGEDGSKGSFSPEITLEVDGGNEEYRVGATYDSNSSEDSDDLLELVDNNNASYSLGHYNVTDRPTYTNTAQLGALEGDEESFQLKIDLSELKGNYSSINSLEFELSFWLYPPE